MNNKKLRPTFTFALFMAFFFFGFQQSAEAQFKIRNNTGCTVNLKVAQRVANCSGCNASGVVSIPSGGTWTHPASAACGQQYWLGFKYFIGTGSSSGVSYNPGLGGSCGADTNGACGLNVITATWATLSATGAGPAKVILN